MLEFSEYKGADAPLGHAHLTIETNLLSWRTRINSLVKNELISQMFDIEREYYSDRMNTNFIAAVDDKDEIVVKMKIDLPQIDGADVQVRFLDAHGKERDLPVYPLYEELQPARRFGDESRSNVVFSVRVPKSDKDFCVSAYDALDIVPGGFAMFCDETYEPLKASFQAQTNDAAHDMRYNDWYLRNSATLADLAEQRRLTFASEPLISLIMPISEGDGRYIAPALQALSRQTYNVFEVVMVDRAFEDIEFEALLQNKTNLEGVTRVKVDNSLRIDQMFEAGLEQAQGQFCAMLYPNLYLAPEALFEVVRRINEAAVLGESASVIYAHHDFVVGKGLLGRVCCKPIYSPDLLLSYNYVGPFVVFERKLVDTIHETLGFDHEALIYDLLFKAFEQTASMQRIDQILYHIQPASHSAGTGTQSRIALQEEEFRGGRRVVANHLKRIGVEATVLSDIHNRVYRVNYALPCPLPRVSVVVINRDRPFLLEACIESLFNTNTYENFEVLIVDNASVFSETQQCYKRIQDAHEAVRVIYNEEEQGFSECVNKAFAETEGAYVLLLDANTELASEEALHRMVGIAQREEVGVVGAKLLFADDTIDQAGITLGSPKGPAAVGKNLPRSAEGYLKRISATSNVVAVSKACQLIDRSVFEEVGGYDERFKLDFNDVDFCLKVAKAGYYVTYTPDVELYHFESELREEYLPDENRIRLEQERAYLHFKWPRAFVEGDPFSSSLLTFGNGYYQLYH
jgi:GT2 family glycosyltransferase